MNFETEKTPSHEPKWWSSLCWRQHFQQLQTRHNNDLRSFFFSCWWQFSSLPFLTLKVFTSTCLEGINAERFSDKSLWLSWKIIWQMNVFTILPFLHLAFSSTLILNSKVFLAFYAYVYATRDLWEEKILILINDFFR